MKRGSSGQRGENPTILARQEAAAEEEAMAKDSMEKEAKRMEEKLIDAGQELHIPHFCCDPSCQEQVFESLKEHHECLRSIQAQTQSSIHGGDAKSV